MVTPQIFGEKQEQIKNASNHEKHQPEDEEESPQAENPDRQVKSSTLYLN